jgi:hypothetical protein
MGVTVAFNYAAWVALFPEFASPGGSTPVTPVLGTQYFLMATMVHRNDGGGPVNDPVQQANLLNLLTAHMAALMASPAGAASASPLVGRISQAAEGSVNVSVELPTNMPMASGFFTQTKYGFMYWTASQPYRTARYLPNNRNPVNAGTFGSGVGYLGGDGTGYTG